MGLRYEGSMLKPAAEPFHKDAGPARAYQSRLDRALAAADKLTRSAGRVGLLRFVFFIVALGSAGAAFDGRGPRGPLWTLSAVSLLLFIALVIHHGTLMEKLLRLAHLAAVNRAGLRRLDGSWAEEPAPA